MSDAWRQRLLWSVAVLVVAAGIWLCVDAARATGAYAKRAASRQVDLESLADVAARLREHESALERVRALAAGVTNTTVAPWSTTPEPGATRVLDEEMGEGWTRRRRELSFKDVELKDILEGISVTEAPLAEGRPGWRLSRCVIRAVPGQPGRADVVVVFDSLVPVL